MKSDEIDNTPHFFVEDDILAEKNSRFIKIANSQQVNTEDKGITSPSPPPRKKRQPTEGGCVGDSLTPADTNSQIVHNTNSKGFDTSDPDRWRDN